MLIIDFNYHFLCFKSLLYLFLTDFLILEIDAKCGTTLFIGLLKYLIIVLRNKNSFK